MRVLVSLFPLIAACGGFLAKDADTPLPAEARSFTVVRSMAGGLGNASTLDVRSNGALRLQENCTLLACKSAADPGIEACPQGKVLIADGRAEADDIAAMRTVLDRPSLWAVNPKEEVAQLPDEPTFEVQLTSAARGVTATWRYTKTTAGKDLAALDVLLDRVRVAAKNAHCE